MSQWWPIFWAPPETNSNSFRGCRKAKPSSSVPMRDVALAAGLRKEQIVRVYSFEAGGNGGYDVQAGLEHDKAARAITTALGYNQLLATNSVEVGAESGPHFVQALSARAAALPEPERAALEHKIAILRKMIGVARSVPDAWNEHQALAGTSKLAIHALNLDVDIGPYLQTQKLMDRSCSLAARDFPKPSPPLSSR
jgi:hypothetical protein